VPSPVMLVVKPVHLCAPAAKAPCRPAFALYGGREIRKWPVLLDFRGHRRIGDPGTYFARRSQVLAPER
jgi:hypothetical protein